MFMTTCVFTDLSDMSEEDVAGFLQALGFGIYVDGFKRNGVDGATLQEMNDFFLKKYGVKSPQQRRRILNAVHQFRKQLN